MQVLMKLFQAQLLASGGRLREAAQALAACSTVLQSAPAGQSGTSTRHTQLRLHCALLQLLVTLAGGDLAALQKHAGAPGRFIGTAGALTQAPAQQACR
jgi:hypothetical protein